MDGEGMQLSNKVYSEVWLLPKKIFGSPLLKINKKLGC